MVRGLDVQTVNDNSGRTDKRGGRARTSVHDDDTLHRVSEYQTDQTERGNNERVYVGHITASGKILI